MNWTEEQLAFINYPNVCFAMALSGSGKTSCITEKIRRIKQVNPAAKVLYITFTRKAKAHGQKKLIGLLDVLVTNYHSLAYRTLNNHKNVLLVSSIDIVPDAYCITILINLHGCKNIEARKKLSRIYELKQDEISVNEMGPDDFNLYTSFQNIMDAQHKFTYTDLILKTNELFHMDQISSWMVQYLKFDYIFIDEQQDNYYGEFKLVENLTSLNPDCIINGVFDTNQSIFSYAGARPTLCLKFMEKFDAKIFNLSYNFRSQKNIVEAGNAFLQNIQEFKEYRPNMVSTKEAGDLIQWQSARDTDSQYTFVCNEILELVAKGYHYKDNFVLYRSNKSGAAFEKVATRMGVPFHLVQGSFLSHKTIKYLIDLIKFSALYVSKEYTDEDIFKSLKNLSKEIEADIADKSWAVVYSYKSLTNLMGTLSNIENITISGIGGTRKVAFKRFYEKILEIASLYESYLGTKNLPKYIEELGNIIKDFKFAKKATQASFATIDEDLEAFYSIISGIRGDLPERVNQFMIDYTGSDADKEDDVVQGMTVHKAKGLENKIVFIIDFDQIPPFWSKNVNINEEGRIVYVAVTRAEEKLYITSTGTNIKFWQPLKYLNIKSNVPSNIFEQLAHQDQHDRW